MDTVLCLIRHGETDWNVARRIQGHLDTPLNEHGQKQARATARSLTTERFAALYCSPLTRAWQTASACAELLKLPIRPQAGLRERHYGSFQGLTYIEAEARHPEDYARYKQRDPDFVPAGGESLAGFARRVHDALDTLVAAHRGERLLLVTHGGVLDIACRYASGRDLQSPRDFPINNAALNWLAHCDGRWSVLAWGEQRHLDSSLDELA